MFDSKVLLIINLTQLALFGWPVLYWCKFATGSISYRRLLLSVSYSSTSQSNPLRPRSGKKSVQSPDRRISFVRQCIPPSQKFRQRKSNACTVNPFFVRNSNVSSSSPILRIFLSSTISKFTSNTVSM